MSVPVFARIQVPSKCFLFGEYVAIEGGPSLVCALAPAFELRIQSSKETEVKGIHADSPAGRWLRLHSRTARSWSLDFMDPHKGAGGFGASTAQFISAWWFTTGVVGNFSEAINLERLWGDYRSMSGSNVAPSGADLVGQVVGGCSVFTRETFGVRVIPWPKEQLRVVFVRTGEKLVTHEHLQSGEGFQTANLAELTRRALRNFERAELDDFFDATREFAETQNRLGLLANKSYLLMKQLNEWPEVQTVRGCGAMGADLLAVYFLANHRESLVSRLRSHSFEFTEMNLDNEGARVSFNLDAKHFVDKTDQFGVLA